MGYLGIVTTKQEFSRELLASEIFHKMEGFLANFFYYLFFIYIYLIFLTREKILGLKSTMKLKPVLHSKILISSIAIVH